MNQCFCLRSLFFLNHIWADWFAWSNRASFGLWGTCVLSVFVFISWSWCSHRRAWQHLWFVVRSQGWCAALLIFFLSAWCVVLRSQHCSSETAQQRPTLVLFVDSLVIVCSLIICCLLHPQLRRLKRSLTIGRQPIKRVRMLELMTIASVTKLCVVRSTTCSWLDSMD